MFFLVYIINLAFQAYTLMLFAKIISSWLPQFREYRFMQFISYCTDPYLDLFRRFIPPLGMIDFSPIVAFFCLSFIQNFLLNLIIRFA